MLYHSKNTYPLYKCRLPLGKNREYGLYGGSFNPVHHGHLAVSHYALTHCRLDKIIWLVTPHNPFKDIKTLAPFHERFEKTKSFVDNPYFIVSDLEEKIQSKNTFQTIQYLCKRYPSIKFTYIIGSDNLKKLHKWHFFKQIFLSIHLAIIVRPTDRYSFANTPAIQYLKKMNIDYDIILRPLKKISSTAIRENKELIK